MALFTSTLRQSMNMIGQRVRPGDLVVDATAGGGNDTVFLSRLVGDAGMVHAFDIQEQALEKTRVRLEHEGLLERVRLHLSGHQHMVRELGQGALGSVRAVMFNFGYFPGSDGRVITTPQTTLPALDAALSLLAPDGVLSLVCYLGHDGGEQEYRAIRTWCRSLNFDSWRVLRHEICNKPGGDIVLFFAEASDSRA